MTASPPSATPARHPAPGFAALRATSTFPGPRAFPPALVGVTLVHAGLLGMLAFAPDEAEPIAPPRPLMVSLVLPEPEQAEPQPAPRPEPPKPTTAPTPKPPRSRVEAPEPPPVPAAKPTPVPVAEPVIEAPAPPSEPVPEVAAPSPPAPVVESTPAPMSTPPRAADYLRNPKPPYPRLSRRLGEEGTVRLNILVNPDGSVVRLELAQSSGFSRLDRSAMETVQSSWKFEPARQGGHPVAAWVIVPIQFTLGS